MVQDDLHSAICILESFLKLKYIFIYSVSDLSYFNWMSWRFVAYMHYIENISSHVCMHINISLRLGAGTNVCILMQAEAPRWTRKFSTPMALRRFRKNNCIYSWIIHAYNETSYGHPLVVITHHRYQPLFHSIPSFLLLSLLFSV